MHFTCKLLILFTFLYFNLNSSAQDYFRMSADFTTKVKPAEGKSNLTKGKIFYDKYSKVLIYDIHFPSKENWIIQNSRIYKIKNDSVFHTDEIPAINEFSIFHLSLNSSFTYYGLREANFSIAKVDKKDDMVISYWNIPPQMQSIVGSIALAKKENSLYSVVMVGPENNILSKQFFKDYIKIGGFEFPGTIVQIYYDEFQQESYQVMEFKNIVLNDTENEKNYRFRINGE